VSVLANIQFQQGSSILASGTVALLSWAGSIVVDATKEEAAEQLSEFVMVAVALILLLLLVLVFDRFFTIQVGTAAVLASPAIVMTSPIPSTGASPRVP